MPISDYNSLLASINGAANVAYGSNPPYGAADFAALYPKFTGAPAPISLTTTVGETDCTLAAENSSLVAGLLIAGLGIAPGTTIASVDGTDLELSLPATASGSISANVYLTPLVPVPVVNAFVALASACLVQARYQELWPVAMGWFIAHFLTLYLDTDGNPAATAATAAAQGAAKGIMTANSAGDVSVSYQALEGLDGWAAWTLTKYGQQFATVAKMIGSGSMYIW
ncbi:MAG TPA: DUF4054 domain-containing protein [Acidobacteriaceae bacterium]|jgi:hypothetical protein